MPIKINAEWFIDDRTLSEALAYALPQLRDVLDALLADDAPQVITPEDIEWMDEECDEDEDTSDEEEDDQDDPAYEQPPLPYLAYIDAASQATVLPHHLRWNRPDYEAYHGSFPSDVEADGETIEGWLQLVRLWRDNFNPEAPFSEKPEGAPDLGDAMTQLLATRGSQVIRLVRQRGGLTYAIAWTQDPLASVVSEEAWAWARAIAENMSQVSSVLGYGLDGTLEYGSRRVMAEKIPTEAA